MTDTLWFTAGTLFGAAMVVAGYYAGHLQDYFSAEPADPLPQDPYPVSEADAWGQAMLGQGWREVAPLYPHPALPRPDRDVEYEFMRRDWDVPRRFCLRDGDPAFNLCGLWYRPLPTVTT